MKECANCKYYVQGWSWCGLLKMYVREKPICIRLFSEPYKEEKNDRKRKD